MMKLFLPNVLLSLICAVSSSGQQVAFTFDDLPAHGPLPTGQTRLQIANSILTTLHDQHIPQVNLLVATPTLILPSTTSHRLSSSQRLPKMSLYSPP
jgi:hypothetical protein